MKVKILESNVRSELEKDINRFIARFSVINIKLKVLTHADISTRYIALIMYEEAKK